MKNKNRIDEALGLIFILSLMVAFSFFVPTNLTGKSVTQEINVSIRDKFDIDFTSFDFQSTISIVDLQNITVEVTNTGSTDYNSTLTTYVYNLSNGTVLTLLSTYADSTVVLYPGNSRGQRYIFAAHEKGDYFVRASVKYGSRVKEVWGSFKVTFPGEEPPPPPPPPDQNQSNQTNGTQPPPSGGGGGGGQQGGGGGGGGAGGGTSTGTIQVPATPPAETGQQGASQTPSVKLDYPERIIVYRNITSLLNIKITDDGATTITGLTFHVSTPAYFGTDINPKSPQILVKNQSITYLIALFTSDAPVGEYTLEFKMLSEQIRKEGVVILEVQESPDSLRDFIYMRIINYEFLINEISGQIESAGARGYDVSIPSRLIIAAKDGLDRAKAYYNDNELVKAFGELLNIEKNMKDAVFMLGNISVKFYAQHDYTLYIIFAVPVTFFLLILYRRRKDRRPRLLREAKEE